MDEIIVASPTFAYQKTWDMLRPFVDYYHEDVQLVLDNIYEKLKEEHDEDKEMKDNAGEKIAVKRLLIFDDVSYEYALNEGNKGSLNGLAYNAVHWNLTMLAICHKSTNIGAGLKENSDFVMFFNTQTPKERKNLWEYFGFNYKKEKDFEQFWDTFMTRPIYNGVDLYPFIMMDNRAGGQLYYKMKERINLPQQ